mgnify:CR=1 FL=1
MLEWYEVIVAVICVIIVILLVGFLVGFLVTAVEMEWKRRHGRNPYLYD